MNCYQKLYYLLFNSITDALRSLEQRNYGTAQSLLMDAQQKAEEQFLEFGEADERASGETDVCSMV